MLQLMVYISHSWLILVLDKTSLLEFDLVNLRAGEDIRNLLFSLMFLF